MKAESRTTIVTYKFIMFLIIVSVFGLLHYISVFSFGGSYLTNFVNLLLTAVIATGTEYLSNSLWALSGFAFMYMGLFAFILLKPLAS